MSLFGPIRLFRRITLRLLKTSYSAVQSPESAASDAGSGSPVLRRHGPAESRRLTPHTRNSSSFSSAASEISFFSLTSEKRSRSGSGSSSQDASSTTSRWRSVGAGSSISYVISVIFLLVGLLVSMRGKRERGAWDNVLDANNEEAISGLSKLTNPNTYTGSGSIILPASALLLVNAAVTAATWQNSWMHVGKRWMAMHGLIVGAAYSCASQTVVAAKVRSENDLYGLHGSAISAVGGLLLAHAILASYCRRASPDLHTLDTEDNSSQPLPVSRQSSPIIPLLLFWLIALFLTITTLVFLILLYNNNNVLDRLFPDSTPENPLFDVLVTPHRRHIPPHTKLLYLLRDAQPSLFCNGEQDRRDPSRMNCWWFRNAEWNRLPHFNFWFLLALRLGLMTVILSVERFMQNQTEDENDKSNKWGQLAWAFLKTVVNWAFGLAVAVTALHEIDLNLRWGLASGGTLVIMAGWASLVAWKERKRDRGRGSGDSKA